MHASVLVLLPLVAMSLAGTKRHQIRDEFAAYVDWVRGKRQSHPDITVAKIPKVPFETGRQGPPQLAPHEVPVPLDYLTPPLLDATVTTTTLLQTTAGPPPSIAASPSAAAVTSITSPSAPSHQGKWELGFDANDILVPPTRKDQSDEYDTLKLFGVTPSAPPRQEIPLHQQAELLLDSFGPPPPEQDSAANRPSPERLVFDNNFNRSPNYSPSATEDFDKPPVYSFVKTNPHGHFKWGVHIGGH